MARLLAPRVDGVGAGGDDNDEEVPDRCDLLLFSGLREQRDVTFFHEMGELWPDEFLLGPKESMFWIRREPKVLGELESELELAMLSTDAPSPHRSSRCGGA